ncbi:MAG: YqaJ viral recombinase family protein, partial [Deltaproteobacteria bacterium]|nr:YqaJ viral recombinase family protein [Deltaproteobacteria bacterium]
SYEMITQQKSEEVGLIYQNDEKLWSCSPDGLYPKNGLEIKCLNAGNHIRVRYEGEIPSKYKPQVYGSLWICNELDSWDFFCYHPDMKPARITVTRDDGEYLNYVDALEKHLQNMVNFINEVIDS